MLWLSSLSRHHTTLSTRQFYVTNIAFENHYGAFDHKHNRKHVGWIIVALLPCRYHSSCLWLMTFLGEKYLLDRVGDSGVAILATWICHVVKGPIPDITVGNPIHYLKFLVATSLQFWKYSRFQPIADIWFTGSELIQYKNIFLH